MEMILKPWPWYVVGPGIALVMFYMMFIGKSFGVSSNFKTLCSIAGAGKYVGFFRFNWRGQIWNLVFILGAMAGGWLGSSVLSSDDSVSISQESIKRLESYGIENPGEHLAPEEMFSFESLTSVRGIVFLVVGGVFVGFGTRYANGCTSGHAISGLSNLQFPSLIAVIGFFLGGLVMTHWILPALIDLK